MNDRVMTHSTFTVAIADRYLEDYTVGSVHEFGPILVEETELIAFARRFDPQPLHTDLEAAAKGMYGGLIASGWHTASLMMRLFVDHFLSRVASLGSPGLDELRWIKPVRPGDALSIRVTVLDVGRSRSKPDRGFLRSFVEVLNQRREVVLTVRAVNILLYRDRA
jgi:acyl dehydratase